MSKYNGWANRETWNVALWLQNEQSLYWTALEVQNEPKPYEAFRAYMAEVGSKATPDGVEWTNPKVNVAELDAMLREL